MFSFILPTRPPTPGEYKVLAIFVSILFIGLGATALVLGYSAPPEKQEIADEAVRYGLVSIACGGLILMGFWILRRFTR